MRVSVVIPCYCSEDALPGVVEDLLETLAEHESVEIVLVNDDSPDSGATWSTILKLSERFPEQVVGIDLALNSGEHNAVLAGLRQATGDAVVVMDDDGQNPPSEVPKLLERLTDDVDVVYSTYEIKRHAWFRNLGSRFTNWVAGILMRKPSGLYLSSYKVMHRRLVDRLVLYPGSFPYIDGLVFRNTRRYAVVQVDHLARAQGSSGYTLRRLLRLYASMAFGFSILPLRLLTFVGVSISIASFALALVFVGQYAVRDDFEIQGWTSLAVLVTFFGGMTLFGLGTLGEYFGRMYLTVTGKKAYVVNHTVGRSLASRKRQAEQGLKSEASTSKNIPFLNLVKNYENVRDDVDAAVARVLQSGYYILGPECQSFERELADYLGGGHTVGVGSGTDALVLAMIAAGVGPGDEVATVATTAIPVPAAIVATGAVPLYVDITADTWAMDSVDLEKRITKATKAIIFPHLYGKACDLGPVMEVARKNNLVVIEDCAQAMGAELGGQKVGTIGDFGAFSFYPTKNLGAMGDGGAVWCGSEETAETLKVLRNYGQSGRYSATVPRGRNSRLDELQAAILRAKLPHLDRANRQRRELGAKMREAIGTRLELPTIPSGSDHVYHLFVGLVDEDRSRDGLLKKMGELGVSALAHYPQPLYKQEAFAQDVSLPVTEAIASRIVSLPLYPEMPEDGVAVVVEALGAALDTTPAESV